LNKNFFHASSEPPKVARDNFMGIRLRLAREPREKFEFRQTTKQRLNQRLNWNNRTVAGRGVVLPALQG